MLVGCNTPYSFHCKWRFISLAYNCYLFIGLCEYESLKTHLNQLVVWLFTCKLWILTCKLNIDLQTVNIDLQTMNIDLQTVNIDLQTVNIDLQTVKIDMQTVDILGFLFRQKLSLSCKTLLHSLFNELNSFFQVWDSWELYDSCPFLIYSHTWTFSTPTPSYVSHILSLCSWVFGCQREDSFTW